MMQLSSLLLSTAALSSVASHPEDKGHPDHDGGGKEHVAKVQTCYGEITVVSTTVIPTTCYVQVTDYIYINSTITHKFTESTTMTSHQTVVLTDTALDTETKTSTETETERKTVTETDTQSITVTTTDTVPATMTTYTTLIETLLQTTYDPCPTSCSVDAATVTLFYWPTDRPYSYPSTYFDEDLDYTFISPSVYMLIPSAKGTNTEGQHVGPSTTNWILGLNLDEVSTIADGPSGSLTRQLELSDLGTDCAQSMDPTAIATLDDSRCAPILAAPTTVSSWAHPCNACGRFGLFDPPYAVPTITGLIEPTTTDEVPSTSAKPTGTIYVIYYDEGEPKSTETVESVGLSGVSTSSVPVMLDTVTKASTLAPTPETTHSVDQSSEEPGPPDTVPTDISTTLPPLSTPSNPDVVTASARRVCNSSNSGRVVVGGFAFWILCYFLL